MKNSYRLQLEKLRDEKATELYWGSPERYPIPSFKMGFDFALMTISKDPIFKEFLRHLDRHEFEVEDFKKQIEGIGENGH